MYKIEKIDGDIALISFNDQTISIDCNQLPAEAKEGDEIDISTIIALDSATENPTENEEAIETVEEEKIEES